ncbi:5566_t:CDS:2, partial [Gigaspora margarita]
TKKICSQKLFTKPTIKNIEFLAASQNSNEKSGDVASSAQNANMILLINTKLKQIIVEQELYRAQIHYQIRRDPYYNEKHTSTDLTLKKASVDMILKEGNSKNNTENQQISYS